ncbi:EF hand [Ostertagia ostertagi]
MFEKGRHEMMCESEVECTSWIRLFRAFDLDHDGFIPTTDLKRAIRDSAFSFGLNPEEVVTMIANIDDNGDKLIDFPEFCTLMSRVKHRRLLHLMFRAAQFVVPKSKRTEPFDYLQKYKCCPPPVFMLIISIIQVAIYIYYTIESGEGVSITGPVPSKSPLIFNPYRKSEVWRYITYMFIHIGIYHVTYNVLTQLLLGVPLELVHQWRVIVVYLAGVLIRLTPGVSRGFSRLSRWCLWRWSFNWIRAIVLVNFDWLRHSRLRLSTIFRRPGRQGFLRVPHRRLRGRNPARCGGPPKFPSSSMGRQAVVGLPGRLRVLHRHMCSADHCT